MDLLWTIYYKLPFIQFRYKIWYSYTWLQLEINMVFYRLNFKINTVVEKLDFWLISKKKKVKDHKWHKLIKLLHITLRIKRESSLNLTVDG